MYTLLFVLASDRDAVYVASQDGARVTYDAANAYRFSKPLDAHDVARRAGHLHGAYGYTVEKAQQDGDIPELQSASRSFRSPKK